MNKKKLFFGLLSFLVLLQVQVQAQQHVWEWARKSGGPGWDIVNDIATDRDGNLYMAGSFIQSAKFGGDSLKSAGDRDVFIARYSPDGTLLWTRQAGGKGFDYASCIQVSKKGLIYVTGGYEKEAGFGKKSVSNKEYCLFLACYDQSGEMLWIKSFNALYGDYITSFAIDKTENIVLGGYFEGKLRLGDKAAMKSKGRTDAFIAKFDGDGNLLWAKQDGGISYDKITAIAIDASNDICITGTYQQTATFGTENLSVADIKQQGVYLMKYNSNGITRWTKHIGQGENISVQAVSVNSKGQINLGGNFSGDVVLNENTLTTEGSSDIFVASYTDNGSPMWQKQSGGKGYDYLFDLATSNDGGLIATGSFSGTVQFDKEQLKTENFYSNVFVAQYNTVGEQAWVKQTGGKSEDYPKSLAVDIEGNIFLAGSFRDSMNVRKSDIVSSGVEDIFLTRLVNCAQRKVKIKGDSTLCEGSNLNLDAGAGYISYNWNNGYSVNRNYSVTYGDIYTVKVKDSLGCDLSGSINVKEYPVPQVNIGKDTTIYDLQTITVRADKPFALYQWSNSAITAEIKIKGDDLGEGLHEVSLQVTDHNGCVAEAKMQVTVKKVIFAEASALKNAKIRIYPNPANGIVHWAIEGVSFEKLLISVVDLSGKTILQKDVFQYIDNTEQNISLQNIAKGVYYISISANKSFTTKKIVVE